MRRPTLALLLGCLLLVAGASALDGYDYYQTIEYAACDQETYQQDIVIHRSTGTAYNETAGGLETWHIFVGDHCLEDYGDIRFTNSTGELAYYLWPDYNSTYARFAVRLEGADQGGALMIWYGNPTATTTSDGDATYEFFDQFNGASLDPEKWEDRSNAAGSTTVSNSNLTLSIPNSDNKNQGIRTRVAFGPGTTITTRVVSRTPYIYGPISKQDPPWYGDAISNFEMFGVWGFSSPYPYFGLRVGSSEYSVGSEPSCPYEMSAIWLSSQVRFTTSTGQDSGFKSKSGHSYPNKVALYARDSTGTSGGHISLDYVLVRAYSATPPAALTFSGERETASPLQPFPGCSNDPTDPDSDGLYEDINGNGRWDFQDLVLFFQHLTWCNANQPITLFDWNSNGRCDFDDVFRLWSNGGMI